MSSYGYDDGYRRPRASRTFEPEYVEESSYTSRGSGRPSTELVFRGRDDDVEEVSRDFPPQSESRRSRYRDDYDTRRSQSVGHRGRYDDDSYTDNYSRRAPSRRDRDDDYYSESTTYSDKPRHRERRKSKVEELVEGFGLGGLAAALTGKNRSRSNSRERDGRSRRGDSDSSSHTGRSRSQENRRKWQQAAKAAVLTGVIEAVRSRNAPGGWTGAKGQRALTAALGAAAVDGFVDRDPEKKSTRHIIEAVIGGLAANRLANGSVPDGSARGRSLSRDGSRSRSRSRSVSGLSIRDRIRSLSRGRAQSGDGSEDGRARSKSRGRGLAQVAGAGAVLAAGKAIYDRVRSKSRGRANDGRDRSASVSSEDSYVPTRRQRYQNDRGEQSNRDMQDEEIDDDKVRRPRGRVAAAMKKAEEGGENKRSASSDSCSTTDLENQRKKSKRTELLTAGLATVATIHAAHGVYSSMVASENRHKLVEEGKLSPEEARKRKSKNILQDVAAVGIAALGIKSAYSEWKEMNEHRHGVLELENRKRKKRRAREKAERDEQLARNRLTYGPGPGEGDGAYGNSGNMAYADGNPYATGAMPVGARY